MLADVPKSEYGPEVERQMCDEIKTFLLAGHETSAAMLIWTMWELVKARGEDENCYEEAKKVYKNSEKKNRKTPSRDELNGLEYIVGALKESLRLYSVVPVVTRKCLGDDYLGGEFVPKGTTVIISSKVSITEKICGKTRKRLNRNDSLETKPTRLGITRTYLSSKVLETAWANI